MLSFFPTFYSRQIEVILFLKNKTSPQTHQFEKECSIPLLLIFFSTLIIQNLHSLIFFSLLSPTSIVSPLILFTISILFFLTKWRHQYIPENIGITYTLLSQAPAPVYSRTSQGRTDYMPSYKLKVKAVFNYQISMLALLLMIHISLTHKIIYSFTMYK